MRTKAAASRIDQARAGRRPQVQYAESWTRSNNPVFVFSSLLTQHQFTEQNFAIGPLNRPGFLDNFQSQVTVEQIVYDWGAAQARIRAAEAGHGASRQQEETARLGLTARVIRAYSGATLAEAGVAVAHAAVRSAEADEQRAKAVREAGLSTDADLLSIQAHLAAMRELEIRRQYEARAALAALNEALGQPLETPYQLTTTLRPVPVPAESPESYEAAAAKRRPDLEQTRLASAGADQQVIAARSALRPQITLRGGFEANRQEFIRQGGANWLVSASLRWNLFDGGGNRARVAEASAVRDAAQAQLREVEQGVRLEVFRAWTEARSAHERVAVVSAAVAQAEESLRITKDRYEHGLATVTDLLRNETALLEARTRHLAAIHDQRLAAAQLELVAGTLSAQSEVLR